MTGVLPFFPDCLCLMIIFFTLFWPIAFFFFIQKNKQHAVVNMIEKNKQPPITAVANQKFESRRGNKRFNSWSVLLTEFQEKNKDTKHCTDCRLQL